MADDLKVKATIVAQDLLSQPVVKMAANINNRLAPALTKLKSTAGGISSSLVGMGQAAIAAIGLGGIGAGIGLDTIITKGADLADMSERVGMTVETIQELGFAANRAGVDSEMFAKSLDIMSKNMGAMKAQTGPLYAFLGRVSPTLRKNLLGAKSNTEAFEMLVDALGKLEDPNKRAALAQAAFGKGAAKLGAMAIGGTAGLAKLRAEAVKLGLITTDQALASEKAEEAMDDMRMAAEAAGGSIVAALVPSLVPLLKEMTDWITNNRELIGIKVKEFVLGISDALKNMPWAKIGETLKTFGSILLTVTSYLGPTGTALTILAAKTGLLSAAVGVLKIAFLALVANPLVAVLLATAAAAYYLTTVIINNWTPISKFFKDLWSSIIFIFEEAGQGLMAVIQPFIDFWAGVFTLVIGRAIDSVKVMFGGLGKYILKVWDAIKYPFEKVASWAGLSNPQTENAIAGAAGGGYGAPLPSAMPQAASPVGASSNFAGEMKISVQSDTPVTVSSVKSNNRVIGITADVGRRTFATGGI